METGSYLGERELILTFWSHCSIHPEFLYSICVSPGQEKLFCLLLTESMPAKWLIKNSCGVVCEFVHVCLKKSSLAYNTFLTQEMPTLYLGGRKNGLPSGKLSLVPALWYIGT